MTRQILPFILRRQAPQICENGETDYPFDNELTYTVKAKEDTRLVVRIPSFAGRLTVNGKAAARVTELPLI